MFICDHCKAIVEYEKSVLESEGRTGLEIVCKKCHSPVCTFMDSWTVIAPDETVRFQIVEPFDSALH